MDQSLRQRRVTHFREIGREIGRELGAAPPVTMLGQAGDLSHRRVLVLGGSSAGLLCELAVTDCRHVETARPDCRVAAGAADVVLVADLAPAQIGTVARQAAVALLRGGSLLVQLPRHARHLSRELRISLVLTGFRGLREVFSPTHRILRADAPAM